MQRFSRTMKVARVAIPAWFALLVFGLDFPVYVHGLLGPLGDLPVEAPAFLLGTAPALVAMIGLWWAGYPADRALREQNMVVQLAASIPVRRSPSLWQYMLTNIRLQLLFMYAPVLLILVIRDLVSLALTQAGVSMTEGVHLLVSLMAMLPVMLTGPVLLVRILPTEKLADSPLRQRLEEMCRRNNLQLSNILLWKTNCNVGNAAVMGILPPMRYLLVTDLLLETMPDEQILAVFAHEIGHIAHRHLLWMAACAFALMFTIGGPVESAMGLLERWVTIREPYASLVALGVTAPLFAVVFGMFVRRLERQADVFAARTIAQVLPSPENPMADLNPSRGEASDPVKGYGASLVCSALKRVAMVNNVPINAHEWLHGSIASRIKFLRAISEDAQLTSAIRRVHVALVRRAVPGRPGDGWLDAVEPVYGLRVSGSRDGGPGCSGRGRPR